MIRFLSAGWPAVEGATNSVARIEVRWGQRGGVELLGGGGGVERLFGGGWGGGSRGAPAAVLGAGPPDAVALGVSVRGPNGRVGPLGATSQACYPFPALPHRLPLR